MFCTAYICHWWKLSLVLIWFVVLNNLTETFTARSHICYAGLIVNKFREPLLRRALLFAAPELEWLCSLHDFPEGVKQDNSQQINGHNDNSHTHTRSKLKSDATLQKPYFKHKCRTIFHKTERNQAKSEHTWPHCSSRTHSLERLEETKQKDEHKGFKGNISVG